MQISERYRPISYLQTNTADLAKELADESGAIVITQDGVPSFVCIGFDEYYQMQETNALIQLVRMGEHEAKEGKLQSLVEARKRLDTEILGNPELAAKE